VRRDCCRVSLQIAFPKDQLAAFCRAHGIWWLGVFGSALRPDFGPESDIDVLVEFELGRIPGLFGFAGMELELTRMLGRKVDLRTPEDLSRHFRQEVLAEAQTQYAQARRSAKGTHKGRPYSSWRPVIEMTA